MTGRVERRMITTAGGVRIATEGFGDPLGVPVVLVMGATASRLWWHEALCRDLAGRGLLVIRYDHRDTGASDRSGPEGPDYTAEDLADDLRAVLDGWGLARAHLVGMSLGGYLAQMLAAETPARVASLTLIGAEPLGWQGPPLPGISDRFIGHFAGFADLDWTDRAAAAAFVLEIARLCAGTGAPFDTARELDRINGELALNPDLRAGFNHGAVTTARDWAGAVARIAVPVLVIHGAEDPILPLQNGRALADIIPGARLLVLPGVGHELPERALPAIAEAIAAQAAAG